MEKKTITILVTGFVGLLLTVALLTTIADQTNTTTSLTTVTDTFNLKDARTGLKVNNTYPFTLTHFDSWRGEVSGCNPTSLVLASKLLVKNQSGGVLTEGDCNTGGYSVTDGTNEIYFCNNANVNVSASNTTTVTYQYCADGYLTSDWGRTMLNLSSGLFAVAILVLVVALVYLLYKKQED